MRRDAGQTSTGSLILLVAVVVIAVLAVIWLFTGRADAGTELAGSNWHAVAQGITWR